MDLSALYHFWFETYIGIGLLILIVLVVCVVVCVIWEIRTRKIYKDRGPKKDEWALFDDEEDGEENETE